MQSAKVLQQGSDRVRQLSLRFAFSNAQILLHLPAELGNQ